MDWWLVVLGVALIVSSSSLAIGFYFPKEVFGDIPSMVFIMLLTIVFMLSGVITLVWGLKK